MKANSSFLEELDAQIAAKNLLKHDFYLAWSRGELSIECLREYAKEYYHHVKAFPTYLSAAHSRTEQVEVRRSLLMNLIEEEAGSPNHPELWKQFALSLGVSEQELLEHTPNHDIRQLIQVFREACGGGTTPQAVAALYAYESQIPAICVSKIKGLKEHYGRHNPKDWEYFSVHIAADKEHAAEERAVLSTLVQPGDQLDVRVTVGNVLDALWNFLSGLCHRYQMRCS